MTSLNCSVMCRPPWWFECCFCRSSWIYCWLLLAVLSNYFGHLVTSTFLLCKFRGLPLLVFPLWAVEGVLELRHRLSQVAQLPGNRAEKTCRSRSRREASNAKSRKSWFYFKPQKVNKFEYCNNLWKQNLFHNPVRKLKAWLYCAHFNDRTDKIVVYFTVYFCCCMFGSFGLFSPCLIEDLFGHKDFKRALFSK